MDKLFKERGAKHFSCSNSRTNGGVFVLFCCCFLNLSTISNAGLQPDTSGPLRKPSDLPAPKEAAEAFSDSTHFDSLCSSATYPLSFRERLLSYSGSQKKTGMCTPEGDIDMLHNNKWFLEAVPVFSMFSIAVKPQFSLIDSDEVCLNPNGKWI